MNHFLLSYPKLIPVTNSAIKKLYQRRIKEGVKGGGTLLEKQNGNCALKAEDT